jgi:hypothetical protein
VAHPPGANEDSRLFPPLVVTSSIVTAVPNLSPGDKFLAGDDRRFRIRVIVEAPGEDLPVNGLWEVEVAEWESPRAGQPVRPGAGLSLVERSDWEKPSGGATPPEGRHSRCIHSAAMSFSVCAC